MQYVYRPGWPNVDIEISPARVPPRFTMTSRRARPIVALARAPGPNTPAAQLMPEAGGPGPWSVVRGGARVGVPDRPRGVNPGSAPPSPPREPQGKVLGPAPRHHGVEG